MGDKSIHLSASLGIGRKPKDGKDGESVTILYTNVSYQVSASPTEIPQSWKSSITMVKQTDAKPYLWTKTEVLYNVVGKDTITYSVSYKGKDGTNGTSFTPKGTATAFYNNMSSVPAYEDGMDYDVYIVNVDDRSNPTSELPPYVCRYEYESFVVEHAEFGDGYNVNGHLYVANSNEWVDFGEIQGAKGEKGDDGIDAINIVFSPAELVFDADDNGNLIQAEKSAEIKVFRGNKQLIYLTDWDFPSVGKQTGDNCKASFMVEESSSPLKPIAKIYDISSTKIVGSDPKAQVPASSGGINVPIKVGDITYNAYLSFSVNVNTFAHTLIEDNKKYISKYTEVSNKYDAVSSELKNKADLKTVESTIGQTAENIKLEVLSKTSGRRNMLVNSAFRNQDSVFIHSLARIEKNTGVDGVNCIHSSDTYSGTDDGNYIGAFWDSTQRNGVVTNIPIVKGKKYVISCWIKSDNLDLTFIIECFFMNSINQQSRNGAKGAISESFKVHETNKWEKISCVLDTDNADATEYLAVNFWSNTKEVPKVTGATDYPICHAYICKPMMEEGDTYGGWTLSEDDYDYVGGNILDNTRSLEKSGNLETEDSEIINEGYEYAYAVAHSNNTTNAYIEMLQWNVVGRINDGKDYMFSFLAKGTGAVSTYLWKDGTPSFFVESSNNKHDAVSTDGNVDFELTNEWKRYWVHYHLNTSSGHPLPEKLLIRCNSGNDIYVCQPKLEIGATMTEFTERKTDLVDKASLKKSGIEITTDKVKLYGDKVQVLTRIDGTPEYEESGMFTNGKFNAKYIDAENIVVNGLQGKTIDAKKATITNLNVSNVKLTGTLRSPFTKANDSFDIGYSDNAAMPVEGGGWKTDYNLPWNVEQSGRRICLTNNLWDGETVFGTVSIDVPDKAKEYGCRFYENGIAKTELCFSSELIELMAYGNISAKNDNEPKSQYIYGWVVLNRVSLVPSRVKFGRQKKVLAYGKVEGTPTAAYINYKTFDGSQDIKVTRNFVGIYVIYIPDNGWFYDKDDIFVTLTGVGYCYDKNNVGSSPAKATVLNIAEVSSTYGGGFNIAIEVSDDETPNDGSFNFELSNFSDFDY